MVVRNLSTQPYLDILQQMKDFTSSRNENTVDELWLLEHTAVYTLGQAGKKEHVLNPEAIPVVQADRGGQVTYHGPGQLVAYILMDLRRRHLGIRTLVNCLEKLLIDVLANYYIKASTLCGAPGVYVDNKKIASIGLRVKNGCTYHGIALNVAMDLAPFKGINPCGFAELEMTQISHYAPKISVSDASKLFTEAFLSRFESR